LSEHVHKLTGHLGQPLSWYLFFLTILRKKVWIRNCDTVVCSVHILKKL